MTFKLSFKVVYKVMPPYFALIHSIGPLPTLFPFLFSFPASPPFPCWSSSSSFYLLKKCVLKQFTLSSVFRLDWNLYQYLYHSIHHVCIYVCMYLSLSSSSISINYYLSIYLQMCVSIPVCAFKCVYICVRAGPQLTLAVFDHFTLYLLR